MGGGAEKQCLAYLQTIINKKKFLPLGQSLTGTHLFVSSLMTVPLGHSQRGTHCLVQMGLGVVQLGGQADPHSLNT